MHSILEVTLENFKHNFNEIKKMISPETEIMPILKDNAYGTYINENITLLNELNIEIIGVAKVDEGIKMRELGFEKEIFILTQPFEDEIENISKYNLTIGCGSIEYLEKLGNFSATFNIHIEIDTGMGRTGIPKAKTLEYIKEAKKYKNINITGIYTQFSCSDIDKNYTLQQLEDFNVAVNIAKKELTSIKYIHSANSFGILNFNEAHFNLVRPGILLYGHSNLKNFKPVTKLKAKISFLKTVPEGTSISYGKTFITTRETKIATVAIGYSSGVRRNLSNSGKVAINKKIAPIIGTICMDSFMVDVTDLDANINDDVYIWDNELITLDDVANNASTITYDILTGISKDVKRIFL